MQLSSVACWEIFGWRGKQTPYMGQRVGSWVYGIQTLARIWSSNLPPKTTKRKTSVFTMGYFVLAEIYRRSIYHSMILVSWNHLPSFLFDKFNIIAAGFPLFLGNPPCPGALSSILRLRSVNHQSWKLHGQSRCSQGSYPKGGELRFTQRGKIQHSFP